MDVASSPVDQSTLRHVVSIRRHIRGIAPVTPPQLGLKGGFERAHVCGIGEFLVSTLQSTCILFRRLSPFTLSPSTIEFVRV